MTLTSHPQLLEQMFACGELALNAAVGPQNGPPLLLLHGVTREWRDWLPVLPELITHYHVFALDHRGHGASQHGLRGYRVADFAADAVAFLTQHVARPAIVWGHSLGAMTAATVAARIPDQVRALILEDPPGELLTLGFHDSRYVLQFTGIQRLLAARPPANLLAAELATMPVQHPTDGHPVPFGELRDAAALRFAAECLVKMDPRVIDELIAGHWLDGLDWFVDLSEIRCPTLLLRADVDCGGMLRQTDVDRIEAHLVDCRRVDRPGLGHNLHATDPTGTLALVRDFLRSLTPAL